MRPSAGTLTIQPLRLLPLKALKKKSLQGRRGAATADADAAPACKGRLGAQKEEEHSAALTLTGLSRGPSPSSHEPVTGVSPETPKRSDVKSFTRQ